MDPQKKSVPELLSDAFSQFSNLLQNEFALARAELTEKLKGAATGVAMIGAAIGLAMPALVVLLIAIAILLNQWGLPPAAAHFCAALLGLAVSGILLYAGMQHLRPSLVPEVTVDQVQKDVAAVKEMAR